MTDQLALLEEPPPELTARQHQALHLIQAAGPDGMTAAELGEALYGSRAEARSWGQSAAQALRKRGLVAQRGRHRVWVALTEPESDAQGVDAEKLARANSPDPERPGSVSAVPPDGLPVFNSMPEGY